MVAKLREEFADLNLTYSIGGQISFDVFPKVCPPCLTQPPLPNLHALVPQLSLCPEALSPSSRELLIGQA